MKKIFFLLMFFMNFALADDSSIAQYFNRFLMAFSSSSISPDEYTTLVSYEVVPAIHSNYDLSPPEEYVNIDNDPHFVMKNTDVLFSGGRSRVFFLDFIKKNILSTTVINPGKVITYNEKNVVYSFSIKKYQQDNVMIFENILSIIPGAENSSEFSCFYDFKKAGDGLIKLIDVNCAG